MPDISQVGYRNRRDTKAQTGASRVRRYNIQGERWPTSNITWSLRRPSPHLKAEPLRCGSSDTFTNLEFQIYEFLH